MNPFSFYVTWQVQREKFMKKGPSAFHYPDAFPKNTTYPVSRPGIDLGSLDPESSKLIIMRLRLPRLGFYLMKFWEAILASELVSRIAQWNKSVVYLRTSPEKWTLLSFPLKTYTVFFFSQNAKHTVNWTIVSYYNYEENLKKQTMLRLKCFRLLWL